MRRSRETGFTKVTAGFVCQKYRQDKSGTFVCIHQEFIAGDDVQYENSEGSAITPPKHDYQPFNMTLLSGPQIAQSIRQMMNFLQMRGKHEAGLQILKILLKHFG
jgi:hypothetical protein